MNAKCPLCSQDVEIVVTNDGIQYLAADYGKPLPPLPESAYSPEGALLPEQEWNGVDDDRR